jgi:putative membrane protein
VLPWLKALHIIGVVAWFAGLFYIFRLFVYHVENKDRPELVAVFEVMERRLYRAICTPAMLWTTGFGLALWSRSFAGYLSFPWFLGKLAALVALFGYHFYAGHVRRQLAAGTCRLTSRQCRALNEIPTLCLVVIVILVVVKPGM